VAHNGEVIEILSGDYRGQPAIWTQDNLTIRGNGERPVLFADGRDAEGKALWVVRGGAIRIENLEFRGARVRDGNGAGIRFERGRLSIHRCAFIDNEMGILTGNSPELTLEISDSEFADAPRHEGTLHHLLYVGAIGRFVLTGSRFSNGYRGHLVKSRARENHVRNNLLADGPDGRASYELEFPNGGLAHVVGNVIAQSATTDNPILVSYGAEGSRWPDNVLHFEYNTLINERHEGGTFLRLWPEKFPDGLDARILDNLTIGVFSNRWMVWAVAASFLAVLMVVYVPFLQPFFDTVPLSADDWLLMLPFFFASPVAMELLKLFFRSRTVEAPVAV
jgi:hypothetical protein